MITPEPNAHAWIVTLTNFSFLGLAGTLGALVRHINTPARKWIRRLPEYFSGALCSIYASELIASATHRTLTKFDVIDSSYFVLEKLLGFAGFLCGR